MSKWKQTAVLLCFLGGLCLFACGKDEAEQNLPDIKQEITEYRTNFIELYTSTAMEETESQINIEEMETDFGDNGEPVIILLRMITHTLLISCGLPFWAGAVSLR